MTPAVPRRLERRVGKRIFLLFVLSALAPLTVMAVLSVSQVRDLLIDQGQKRISGIAKSLALGVYERLLTARDAAQLMAARSPGDGLAPPAFATQFRYLGLDDGRGPLRDLIGNASAEAPLLAASYRSQPAPRNPRTLTQPNERLWLLQDVPGKGVLVGELNPAYLWGDLDEVRAGMVICVIDSTGMLYVRCPLGREIGLPALLGNAGQRSTPNSEPTNISWRRDGVPYRGRVWAQFMANDFGSRDWYFAASVPEEDFLAPANAFRYSFVLVVALALLLIVWFSDRQIRAMLTPLGKLAAGTRRIANNDFSARVDADTSDEFGELGVAFNAMSARLGRQFLLSEALSELNRMILDKEHIDSMVRGTLGHLEALLPALRIQLLLIDRSDATRGCRYWLLEGVGPDTQRLEKGWLPLPPGSHPASQGAGLLAWPAGTPLPVWAGEPAAQTAKAHWVQMLRWGGATCGWLWISSTDAAEASISEDERRVLDELASRLALAIVSVWRDDDLYRQAHFDPLTGLPNRMLFRDRLQREISRSRREGGRCAVLFVDLDNFKAVNDSQGHGAGDFLLCEAARRIGAAIRETDTASRHGGDEFTVLLVDIAEPRDALRAGDAIIAALSAPFQVGGQDCFLSASVGIALCPGNGDSAEALLKNSDTAMYRAKAAGRGQSMFFEERMNADTVARIAVDRELRQALERGELRLYFQPQVALVPPRVEAAEALIRWQHPQRGLLGPGDFIAVAEESGLIGSMGRWVIENAAAQLAQWRRDGLVLDRVSVNVSARQFRDPDFVAHVMRHVVEPGLAASFEFEITETAMLERMDLLEEKLRQLSAAGCKVALDDFGTGFSSMAYLKKLTVHVVKIDRAFIEDIDKSAGALAFVDAIIAMAHALGKVVVAEGAENQRQVTLLRERGCDLVQGYHFSEPLPPAEFAAFCKQFNGG